MKGKTFIILLVSAFVLVGLPFLRFGGEKNTKNTAMGEKLFADMPINTVAKVNIADAENQVTLVKGESVWQVEERNGYAADFNELREMVMKLSRLKIGRSFSGSPESITRLSLMPPSSAEASGKGKQLTLQDASGNTLADIILGEARKTESGSGGQYLKKTESDTIFLVDGNFQFLKTSPPQWLEKEVLDIKAKDIESVVCYSEGNPAPVYTLSRPKKDESARLSPVPDGRTANSSKIDQIFDALSPLTLDDVQAGDKGVSMDESDQTRLVYHLYDGMEVTIFPDTDENEPHTLRLAARQVAKAETPKADASNPKEDTPSNKNETGETSPEVSKEDSPKPKSAHEINEELGQWVFSVKKWQFDSFITKPELLLEDIKKDET